MSLADPNPLGTNFPTLPRFQPTQIGANTPATSGPIITSLPSTQKSLAKKYNKLSPILSQLPPNIVNSLVQYDTQRALRGAQPLSNKETAAVLSSALTGQAATPDKQRGIGVGDILGNAVHDLGNILTSVPRLPVALYKEAKALPEAPGAISEALGAGSPSKVLQGLAEAPGLRMLPGAFTVDQLAKGQPGELLRHPLMTLLDVYPAAKEVGLTGKLAEQVSAVTGKALATPLGEDLRLAVRGNPGFQLAQQMFGKSAREDALRYSVANKALERKLAADPSISFAAKYSSLPAEDHAAVFNALETGDINSLPERLQGYATEASIESNRLAEFGNANNIITKLEDYGGSGQNEYFDNRTANKYLRRKKAADVATMEGQIRQFITDPANTSVESLSELGSTASLLDAQAFDNAAQRVHYLNGVTHAIEQLGFDTTELRSAIKTLTNSKSERISREALSQMFTDFAANPTPLRQVPDLSAIRESVASAARRDPKIAVFNDQLKRGNYSAALDTARQIGKRTKFLPDNWDDIVESVRRENTKAKYLASKPVFDEAAVQRATKRLNKFTRDNAPARFKTAIVNKATDNVLAQYASDPNIEAVTQAISEQNYSQFPGLKDAMEKEVRNISKTWQTLRDEGLDPVFIHHLSPQSASAIQYPSLLDHNFTEGWANKRTMDITPYVPDATVAIPHQALQTLQRLGTEEYLDSFVQAHGFHAETPLGDKPPLINEYLPAARRRFPNNPELVRQEAERLMRKENAVFDPNTILPKSSRLTNFGNQEQIWVRKSNLKNLERLHTPMKNGFTAVMDPIMNVFRTSILPLSPRWQVNNVVGGGMMAVAEDPNILRYMDKAIRMMKTGELPEYLAQVQDQIGIGSGLGQLPKESLEWNRVKAQSSFQYLGGKTLKRLYESAGKAREIASNGVQKAYDMNAFMDDAYRSAAYLSGYDKALTKGMSAAEAESAGIALATKILPRWNEMTPLERSVMRYVFPFYGWVSHIMPYVLKYPFDHPLRAQVMSAITRNEIEDMGTGLPERFLSAFFLGHPDKDGKVHAIQTSGFNPFGGVANYFTWAGFAGNVNPIVQTALESMGIDTQNGSAELYPDLTYDPESGRLTTKGKSFLPTLVGNIIPQSDILLSLAGASNDFKSLLASDPAAAGRQLLSAGGVPILYRQFNLPQEQFKAELARQDAQTTAKSKALKSGDIDSLNRYPALRAMVKQIKLLQAQGKLTQFNPQASQLAQLQPQSSILDALRQAVS